MELRQKQLIENTLRLNNPQKMILKTKSVEISDEPLGCQIIFSDTDPQFDNDDEKYILKLKKNNSKN